MTKTAQDIIEIITNAGAEDNESIRFTLEDGAALLSLGVTDEDQETVEEAHAIVSHAK